MQPIGAVQSLEDGRVYSLAYDLPAGELWVDDEAHDQPIDFFPRGTPARDVAARLREKWDGDGWQYYGGKPYLLTLSADDWKAVEWVGNRYCWSAELLKHGPAMDADDWEPAPVELTEAEAWALVEAIEADAEGGHSILPCIDSGSPLWDRLVAFTNQVV